MDTNYLLASVQVHRLLEQQFRTPEFQHRVAIAAAREPWRSRLTRSYQRLKALASQQPVAQVREEACS